MTTPELALKIAELSPSFQYCDEDEVVDHIKTRMEEADIKEDDLLDIFR